MSYKKHLLTLSATLLTVLLSATPAWALSLQQAKTQGLVGEQTNGYLGIPQGSGNTEVHSLMETINKKRMDAYKESAADAGVTLEIMEKRVGQRLINKAPDGHYVQTQDGHWVQK